MLKKVQVGDDQENVQSERNSHSKNRGGKKIKKKSYTKKTYRKPSEQLFPIGDQLYACALVRREK